MMQLIDADKMINSIILDDNDSRSYELLGVLVNWIKNQPTADAMPVKHGRWKEHHTKVRGYGKVYYQHDCTPQLFESPYFYCPTCGAKMDKEEGS